VGGGSKGGVRRHPGDKVGGGNFREKVFSRIKEGKKPNFPRRGGEFRIANRELFSRGNTQDREGKKTISKIQGTQLFLRGKVSFE